MACVEITYVRYKIGKVRNLFHFRADVISTMYTRLTRFFDAFRVFPSFGIIDISFSRKLMVLAPFKIFEAQNQSNIFCFEIYGILDDFFSVNLEHAPTLAQRLQLATINVFRAKNLE